MKMCKGMVYSGNWAVLFRFAEEALGGCEAVDTWPSRNKIAVTRPDGYVVTIEKAFIESARECCFARRIQELMAAGAEDIDGIARASADDYHETVCSPE